MTSQTLKRNCKNLFTNSERLCSLERNIPKIKLSLNDKSIDRSLPSPRLKAFPPEKIKRINDNISLQSTIRENLLCNTRQNIGHGDAISNHEKLTMISNSQFIRKEQKNKNIAYFHPIENENQSESILITEKNSPSLSTYRSFAPNSLSASAIQQCSSRNKATPRPIVSHLPSHRDNISNSEPKTDSQKTKIDPENTKNPEKISSPENQESVIQHSETLKKHEKIGKITENEKMTKNEENNEFILDNCENETNYEKQPIGGRIGATYRESYLKENTNFQKEFPHKELKQQVMKQLSMSAPVYHQRHSIDSNNLFDKCPTRSQMENIKQVDQQLHNSICQQRDIAFDRNHHSMEQKQNSCNFYNSNFCHIMTSPQDFSLNRQKCYYQNLKMNSNNFQVHSNNLTVNPNNFQANANNLKVNSKNLQDNLKNFQVNPNNFQINPNNFQDNPNNLQVNTNNFQVSANNLQVNPNKFQDNLNCYQDNSNNSQTIFNNNCQATLNDKFSQDNYLLQMNPNNRTHFTSFSLDLVNPELKQLQAETEERQQIVPNDNYSHNNHTNHNKMTIKSTDMQQRSKISNKVYYFTPQMLKDQELLLTTMQQQQFSEDMMMRQFQLLLNEQKKQLAYLESCTQTEEKIIRRVKNNVSKKITAKNSIDEKPDWMAHITPPRITYCEMEKIKCYGFDIQQSNWNCENRQGVDESDQQRCDDKCQNWRQCQEKHQDRQRQEYQRHDQKSECLTWNHQQEQKNLSNKNFRVEQNQCGKSQSDFERYQHFRMQNKNRHRHAEMHHQNSHVDQKMHHHHRGQHCLHKRHQQAELQKQSMANHFQQLGHNQGYIQQPLIQNQTSLIPSQQSFVHQQSPNQQSLMHQKFVVPQHQLLVPQQQLMVADQKSLAPQQLMEPNQKTMVPQQQLMVADQKSLQLMVPYQKSEVTEQQLMVPHQKSFVPYHKSLIPYQQSLIPNQKSLLPCQQSSLHHQPLVQHQHSLVAAPLQQQTCQLHSNDQNYYRLDQKFTPYSSLLQRSDENCLVGENLKTLENSSLLRLRYHKQIVQPQQRNNGLQDPEIIKEALEALEKPNQKRGLEYLTNLNKKIPVIKLNGAQEPQLIPQEFLHQPLCQETEKNVSANGLENQRNPSNPVPPIKMRNFDNELTEYPRSKKQCFVNIKEKETQIPGTNFSEAIQYPHYYIENLGEPAICQNVREHVVQYENLMTKKFEIQEPRIIGGFTYLARKLNSLP